VVTFHFKPTRGEAEEVSGLYGGEQAFGLMHSIVFHRLLQEEM